MLALIHHQVREMDLLRFPAGFKAAEAEWVRVA
jgi:hypothetical protein